ncbi:MAG TPA: NUDIX hydrolase [Candidatus Acidoferrum sp.]|nr:NUDIX hydrolase [Candidatus Acidoferrum sp.]
MASPREYPERPIVGVGGVLIEDGKALLIRRGSEPLLGQWSIPGGTLELGETLREGVAREMAEETGIIVRVLDLIEVFERINPYLAPEARDANVRPRFHFVIADYLCEKISGEAAAGGDATDVAYVAEEDLPRYQLTEAAMRVLRSAFAMDRNRRAVRRP